MPVQKPLAKVITSNVITRPSDTTAYAVGDLVANSTTANQVTPFSFANAVDESGVARIERMRMKLSSTSLTNASFRIHLYNASPTVANGDNGAWSTAVGAYIGAFDVTIDRAFSDGSEGAGIPMVGSGVTFTIPSGTTLYALVEARGAYTPTSAGTITLIAELVVL